jgi:hypothetical protein
MDLYELVANAVSAPALATPDPWLLPLQSGCGGSVLADRFRQHGSGSNISGPGGPDPHKNWPKLQCICLMSKKELMKKCSWLLMIDCL